VEEADVSIRLSRGILVTLFAVCVTTGLAIAQVRKAGDVIVYNVTVSAHGSGMGQGSGGKLMVNVNQVDAEGSAQASLTFTPTHPAGKIPSFPGTVSPAGAIFPTVTSVGTPHVGMSADEIAAASSGAYGITLQFMLQQFDAFATAAAAREALHVGDSWHATTGGLISADTTYKVTGREQHLGRDSFVIQFESAPGAQGSTSGQGYYDASSRTVVAIQYDTQLPGGHQGGTTDITLAP
jgi:hypothetical protein